MTLSCCATFVAVHMGGQVPVLPGTLTLLHLQL